MTGLVSAWGKLSATARCLAYQPAVVLPAMMVTDSPSETVSKPPIKTAEATRLPEII